MNPDATIRPWLIACGAQFGIRQVHPYRWPDASNNNEMYCTYKSIDGDAVQDGYMDLTSATGNIANVKHARQYIQRYQIDLYRSQGGLYELEAFAIAASSIPSLKKLFDDGGCQFVEALRITDETKFDDERIDYNFRMICNFIEFVEINIDDVNGVVDQIDLTLETESPTFEIDDAGISVT